MQPKTDGWDCLREVSDATRTRMILSACVRAHKAQTDKARTDADDKRRTLARMRLAGWQPTRWVVGACQL